MLFAEFDGNVSTMFKVIVKKTRGLLLVDTGVLYNNKTKIGL